MKDNTGPCTIPHGKPDKDSIRYMGPLYLTKRLSQSPFPEAAFNPGSYGSRAIMLRDGEADRLGDGRCYRPEQKSQTPHEQQSILWIVGPYLRWTSTVNTVCSNWGHIKDGHGIFERGLY